MLPVLDENRNSSREPAMNPRIDSLKKLLDGPRDGALLRFSLGNEYLKAGAPAEAAECFRVATEKDPAYSTAWKLLGKARVETGDIAGAEAAYTQGINTAEARGDIQAAREMRVFLKRLLRTD
jgi:predicted Zn-dependent protease